MRNIQTIISATRFKIVVGYQLVRMLYQLDLASKHTTLNPKVATNVLHSSMATSNVSALMASTLKTRCTLRKTARVNRGVLQECSSLGSFGSDIVPWVSGRNASQSTQADGNDRCKMNHGRNINQTTGF